MNFSVIIPQLLDIAVEAGNIIMHFYKNGANVEIKEDNSPVTEADIAANDYIVEKLAEIAPDITIISEEGAKEQNKGMFWLVDPLDGTKSFIKKTGEFTVNIALIDGSKAVIGVVYVPVTGDLYYTNEDGFAYKKSANDAAKRIEVRRVDESLGLVVVASKSHIDSQTEEYIKSLNVAEFISASSSLKFCLIAEGRADIYPRFAPTMEWDTAAAHAVLTAAGGEVLNPDGTEFIYRKKDFRNGFFIASGKAI